jgi:hypothetical protein
MKLNQAVGFRLHQRHVAVLVGFFALLLGFLTPMARNLGAAGRSDPTILLMVLAPWLVAVPILILERKNPVKFWLAPLLLSVLAPAIALGHDWLVLDSWPRSSWNHDLLVILIVNIFLIGAFTIFATDMAPRHCTDCKRWAMIPLRGILGTGFRTPNTRWCVACGAKYWRTTEGEWREERRRDWFDNVKESTKLSCLDSKIRKNRFDPDSRMVNPILSSVPGRTLAAVSDGIVAPEILVQELRRSAQTRANGRIRGREEEPEPLDKFPWISRGLHAEIQEDETR